MRSEDGADRPGPEVIAFLVAAGLVDTTDDGRFTPLTGGVASDIWRVEQGSRAFVVKKALARLRVARDWRAPVSRNASEVAWLRVAGRVATPCVPTVLAHDPAIGAFAMSYLDPVRYPVWKRELLDGRVDPGFAAEVGERLGQIHLATGGDADIASQFETDGVFHAIRLEPYLEATAALHPDLSDALFALSRTTLSTKRALVHGDVSPKNILVGPDGPVFLDAECAWYGDPAFDLAFCLNHLLLKAIAVPAAREALEKSFHALAEAYFKVATFEPRAQLEPRAARLLPALLLARVDGKSPVEYVTEGSDRARIRRVARLFVASGASTLVEVSDVWNEELRG